MTDMRCALKDGDFTSTGGRIIGTGAMLHHGTRVAVEGDLATCPACNATGVVQNDCHLAFKLMGKQILVEHARVYCRCPTHPVGIASQRNFRLEVNRGGGVPYRSTYMGSNGFASETSEKIASDFAGEQVADNAARICPNMLNETFREHIMQLRDEALLLVNKRLQQLYRWEILDQQWFGLWFGTTHDDARTSVVTGLHRMRDALSRMSPANFIRYSAEAMRAVGCVSRPNSPGVVAEVCAPDTATHTIAIRLDFCTLRPRHPRFDSQLLTLVHEVSHFTDVFGSRDHRYSTFNAKKLAHANDPRALENADNIAGFIVCSE